MARIDNKDDYIVCDLPRGARRCGGRIGRVAIVDGKRHWALLPGWRNDPELSHEPPNDIRRRELGHPPDRNMARQMGHRVKTAYVTPFRLGGPLRIRCSDCHQIQEVVLESLGFVQPESSVVGESFRAP